MASSGDAKKYEIVVGMTCDGCKGAVTRILSKVEGVQSFECDVAAKKVTVTGTAAPEQVIEKLDKWAKASNKELKFGQYL